MKLMQLFRTSPFAFLPRRGRRRGATLIESTVALASFSGVGIFTVALLVSTAKQSRRAIQVLPSDMNSFRLTDQVREKAFSAQNGRFTLQDDHNILFVNPSLGLNVKSRIHYSNGSVWYTERDGESTPVPLGTARGLDDARFSIEPDGRGIRVTLVHRTKNAKNQIVAATKEEVIRARN